MTGHLSAAALDWLAGILQERFGHAFLLRFDGKCELHLSIVGQRESIGIVVDADSFGRSGYDLPCAAWDAQAEGWESPLQDPIPAPGASVLPVPLIARVENGYSFGYDVLGLCYWMLTRREEVGRVELDDHERFPATRSHAFRHGYLERPLVDEWLHVLGQVVQRVWPHIQLKVLRPSMRVSHDVDSPSRYAFESVTGLIRTVSGDLLRRRTPSSLIRGPWLWINSRTGLHPKDPSNTFEWIMDKSDEQGLKSAFYFICGRTSPREDASYEIEDARIRKLLRRIHERGHEIGLHPSYRTFQAPQVLAEEALRLKRICAEEGISQKEWGGRMHFLRWETPTTLHGWERADMDYETTLSYADRPGFRCGTCHEYAAFDPVEDKQLQVRIRPLIAMECTVIAARYLGLGDGEAAYEKFIHLKRACEAVGGSFTVLWHNSHLEKPAHRRLYSRVLAG